MRCRSKSAGLLNSKRQRRAPESYEQYAVCIKPAEQARACSWQVLDKQEVLEKLAFLELTQQIRFTHVLFDATNTCVDCEQQP